MMTCPVCTHCFIHKLLQDAVEFVPHVVHVLLDVVLCIIPLLFQLILHDHLTLEESQ